MIMFTEESIVQESARCFTASAACESAGRAEQLRSGYIGPVRQISLFADLYCAENRLVLEAPDRETLLKLMDILNHSIDRF